MQAGQDGEMETLMSKIQEYKKEISALRHQLDAREDKKIAELENQASYLRSRVAELDSERDSMKIVEKRQMGALQSLKNDTELKRMAQRLETEIKTCLEKEKAAKQKIAKDQTEWKAVHQQMVSLEERFRELQRRKPNAITPETEAHNKELAEWQKKVDILEKSTASDEKVLKMKCKELEQRRKEIEEEKSRLDTEIARLTQDIPLKELKQKELKTRLSQLQKRNAELIQLEAERQAKEKEQNEKPEPLEQPEQLEQPEKLEDTEPPQDPQSTLFAATQLEESA